MSTFLMKRADELGLEMADAEGPITLSLTAKDIKQSKTKDSRFCAFARAAKRQYKCKQAYFFRQTAWLEYENKLVRYHLPSTVQREIVAFDRDGGMMPGQYKLTPHVPSSKLGKERKVPKTKRVRKKHDGSKALKKKVAHQTEAIRTLDGLWYVPKGKK